MTDEITALKRHLAAAEAVVIGQQIDAALEAVGVVAPFRVAARALLIERKPELIDGEAFLGGQSLSDVVKAWAATAEGKTLTTAPAGVKPPKGGKGAPVKKCSEMTTAEKGAYVAKHGLVAYEALPR